MIFKNGNQAFINVDPQVADFIAQDPLSFVASLTDRQRKVFNCMLYWASTTGSIYLTQKTLAKYAGYMSREHVNRLVAQFVEWGLIASRYRYMTSCVYKVSSFFNDFKIRALLKKYLSSLSYFPKQLLEPDVTLYTSINLLIAASEKQQHSASRETQSGARACVREKQDAVIANSKGIVVIAPYVDGISNPALTHEDKVSLSRYSEAAIRDALRALQRNKGVTNPIAFLIGCARKYDTTSAAAGKKGSAAAAPRKEIAPKDIQDDSFWKKDNEKMAHWSLLEVGLGLKKAESIMGKEWTVMLTGKIRDAHGLHVKETCHLCIEHGREYVHPFGTQEERDTQAAWESGKTEVKQGPIKGGEGEAEQPNQPVSPLRPPTTREKLAELAGKALAMGSAGALPPIARTPPANLSEAKPRPIGEIMQNLAPEVAGSIKDIDHQTPTTINEVELEGSEEYYGSEYQELFSQR